MVSPLAGIRAAVSKETTVVYAKGCEISGDDTSGIAAAVEAARRADVAVVVVGGKSGLMPDCTSGEFRDATDLSLTGVQQQLVEAVAATGTPTVVVLVNGRIFALPWIAEYVPAVVEAWLPGEEGGNAIADVLFGAVNPAGRLPVSMPRAVGQVPIYYNHKSGGGRSQMLGDYTDLETTPLFPFGHGLSYTRFEYANLSVTPAVPSPQTAAARRGRRHQQRSARRRRGGAALRPRPRRQRHATGEAARRLRPRAASPQDETRRVVFTLDPSQLAFFDAAMRFVVEPGRVPHHGRRIVGRHPHRDHDHHRRRPPRADHRRDRPHRRHLRIALGTAGGPPARRAERAARRRRDVRPTRH